MLRPDVVLFGEPIRGGEEAAVYAGSYDVMVIVGTSLTV
ncbi:MAG: Sir2 family NAD-dependent protein deacetylase [Nitrososphaerales archaeon]